MLWKDGSSLYNGKIQYSVNVGWGCPRGRFGVVAMTDEAHIKSVIPYILTNATYKLRQILFNILRYSDRLLVFCLIHYDWFLELKLYN